MKRSLHNLTKEHKTSIDAGKLYPLCWWEALPGDTMDIQTQLFMRVTRQLAPVMHKVDVRTHTFFVPYQQIWSPFGEFITGKDPAATIPTISLGSTSTEIKTLSELVHYLGAGYALNQNVSALPVRAYNHIYNTMYRDDDVISEVAEDSVHIQKIAWEKDYFTTARANPQAGTTVTVPLGDSARVATDANQGTDLSVYSTVNSEYRQLNEDGGGDTQYNGTSSTEAQSLYADLSSATGTDIIALRNAFAMQRYQENRQRFGDRYTEFLRFLGVTPDDRSLSTPQYLGGGKSQIDFSEVMSTYSDVGALAGHGMSGLRSNRFRAFFREYGIVMTLISIRPKTVYQQAVEKFWFKEDKEDFWQKELQYVGAQEIYNKEVYGPHSQPNEVFGYNDRYNEYREGKSYVTGEMTDVYNDWHLGRIWGNDVALNKGFIECDASKRHLADQLNNGYIIRSYNRNAARRLVDPNASARLF
jgi:hypothetical protein